MQIRSNYSMNGVPYENRRRPNDIPQFSTERAEQENESINPYLRRRGRGAGGGVRQVRGRHPDHLRAEGSQEAAAQADVHQHSVSAL